MRCREALRRLGGTRPARNLVCAHGGSGAFLMMMLTDGSGRAASPLVRRDGRGPNLERQPHCRRRAGSPPGMKGPAGCSGGVTRAATRGRQPGTGDQTAPATIPRHWAPWRGWTVISVRTRPGLQRAQVRLAVADG